MFYMSVDYVETVLTRRTRNVIPSECNPNLANPPAFGLSPHSDFELLIGQPSDSRRADPFSEQLANQ
jgi:hypothetical protein